MTSIFEVVVARNRRLFLLIDFSIDRTEFNLGEYRYDIMISRFFRMIFVTKINGRSLVCIVVRCIHAWRYIMIVRSHDLLQYDDMALPACRLDSAWVPHNKFDPF
jgi:hypothetical protein